jgi:hypothetical protein
MNKYCKVALYSLAFSSFSSYSTGFSFLTKVRPLIARVACISGRAGTAVAASAGHLVRILKQHKKVSSLVVSAALLCVAPAIKKWAIQKSRGAAKLLLNLLSESELVRRLLQEMSHELEALTRRSNELRELLHRTRIIGGGGPLHEAVYWGNMDLVRSSIQQGSRVDSRTLISCNTPLHVAVLQDNINAVQLLVQAGANTALLNLEGRTPRDLAVNQEIINYLDNVDQLSRDLIAAVQAGNVELVRNLVAQGAPLMVPDSQGQTPLHYAIGGYAQQPTVADTIAQELIGVLGPRVALIQNQENQTLLHTAASRGNVRVALMLLQHGVDVNRADNQGDTALNVSGSVPMSRVLAENGAWQSMNAGPSSVPEEQRILALFAGNH